MYICYNTIYLSILEGKNMDDMEEFLDEMEDMDLLNEENKK